jgi:hypothetical protein
MEQAAGSSPPPTFEEDKFVPQKDPLGDRMKDYERRETERTFMPFLPVYARIDGRSFSKFTVAWTVRSTSAWPTLCRTRRPSSSRDRRCHRLHAVGRNLARVGDHRAEEEMFFAGKVQKLCSVLAGMASSFFLLECLEQGGLLEEKARKAALRTSMPACSSFPTGPRP